MRLALLAALALAAAPPRGDDAETAALLDRPAPPLPALAWSDGRARSLADLRGQVVVLRAFTDRCPFCAATLPALEAIDRDYRGRGVVVLGVYHPKPPRPATVEEAREHARRLGAGFPVAADPGWELIERWWLEGGRHWTSVTWLIDREGVVRWVHPGGEYHRGGGSGHERCRADEADLRRWLERLARG